MTVNEDGEVSFGFGLSPASSWASLISIWDICIVIRKLAHSMHMKRKCGGVFD